MANWKEYTTKTTPEDADEIMIADTKANANKRTPFSGLWNWIAGKLATAVISQLETQSKSIIPALNELNSKTSTYTYNPEKPTDISIPNYKAILVCYSSISTNNITGTGFAVIQSRQDTKTTGGIIEVQQLRGVTLSLVENKLLISSPTWLRITVTVL